MQAPIRDEVRREFAFLFQDHGFTWDADAEASEYVAVIKSGPLRIRFVRDRADFFADFARAANRDTWRDCREIIKEICPHYSLSLKNSIHVIRRLLTDNILAVIEWAARE